MGGLWVFNPRFGNRLPSGRSGHRLDRMTLIVLPKPSAIGGQLSVIIMMRMRCGHDDHFRMVMVTLVAIAVVPTVIVMTSGGGEECKGAGQ